MDLIFIMVQLFLDRFHHYLNFARSIDILVNDYFIIFFRNISNHLEIGFSKSLWSWYHESFISFDVWCIITNNKSYYENSDFSKFTFWLLKWTKIWIKIKVGTQNNAIAVARGIAVAAKANYKEFIRHKWAKNSANWESWEYKRET